nr:hypothetical protein [Alcaligenes faecalis]
MKKEEADQLIRCVKECWWRVLAVISLPVAASISIFSDWPWKDSPWTAIAAIATFAASWSALYISQKEGRRRILLERSVATIAVGATIATLSKYERGLSGLLLRRGLEKFGRPRESAEYDIHQIDIFERHKSVLSGLKDIASESQLEKMIVLPYGFSGRVAAISAEAVLLVGSLEHTHIWLRSFPSQGHIRDHEDVIAYWASLERIYLEMADLLLIARKFFNAETGNERL